MKVRQKIQLIILSIIISGCVMQTPVDKVKQVSAVQEEQRALLIGAWFGDYNTKDGGRREQITQRAPDGTYQVTFRVTEPSGRSWEQTEIGFWGVSGSVYFTITRGWFEGERFSEADPTAASLNDAYEILELNQDMFRYRSLQSSNEYTLSRVDHEFEFPKY